MPEFPAESQAANTSGRQAVPAQALAEGTNWLTGHIRAGPRRVNGTM